MEGQNFYALSLEQCLLKLEPHHFGAVNLTALGLVIALNCAIIDAGLSNFFRFLLIVMAGLAGLTIADSCFYKELAFLCHNVSAGIHTDFLSALIELYIIYL